MFNFRRISFSRPSASLVIAVIALIMSLTGTAFAAGVLPANSVATKHLKPWAVSTPKIQNAAVTARKIQPNAVGSSKVADRSLLAVDFAEGQLPAGPKGDAGTARAYAQVTGGATPAFVTTATKNFTKVTRGSVGVYCLTPAAGAAPSTNPAVVSVQSDIDDPAIAPGQFALWQASATGCAAGDYVVRTYRIYQEAMGGSTLANDVSFAIIVA